MEKNSKLTFEEALKGLEEAANALKRNDGTLEEAIKQYEQGISFYEQCAKVLKEAQQRIEIYDKKTQECKEF